MKDDETVRYRSLKSDCDTCEWSSPGLMDTFSLMKESVFHAENEEPVTPRNLGNNWLRWRELGAVLKVLRGSMSPAPQRSMIGLSRLVPMTVHAMTA